MHFDGRKVFFVHKRKAKICKSISQAKRRRFAKVFHKKKGQRFAKVFLKKGQRFAKVFKYSSIQKKYSNCFGSFQGDKKDMQVHNISISEQNCNDKDLITCGLHYPSATGLRSREGDEPRPAFRGGRLCSAALRPGFYWSSTAPEARGRPTY